MFIDMAHGNVYRPGTWLCLSVTKQTLIVMMSLLEFSSSCLLVKMLFTKITSLVIT